MNHFKKYFCIILSTVLSAFFCVSCGNTEKGNADNAFDGGIFSKQTIRILSGSENKELEDILKECAKEKHVGIQITYKGSVDIMNELKNGAKNYDAVWPASGMWISLGDTKHITKHDKSISQSPVVFGIKKSVAESLGFVGKDVSVKDILEAINSGKLKFCMTSATQSNSGASAYMGFLYALTGKKSAITESDLDSQELKENMSGLLSGINRSSGSSDWLKEMFLKGNYDAMVNYESLIISANNELVSQGKEPLYTIYTTDGLTISDSPLAYVDHGDKDKEEAFLSMQEYLLSDDVQKEICKKGRRVESVEDYSQYDDVFRKDWGIDTSKVISSIQMPNEKTLMKALEMYQSSFRKPSLNVYCLDYSGSMDGKGNKQLVEAMGQLLIRKNAEKNFLQPQKNEVNIVITFSSDILNIYTAEGDDEKTLEKLYSEIKSEKAKGGTDMYVAANKGLEIISKKYDISKYSPAVILMTDGESETTNRDRFMYEYSAKKIDIPVFSIMFGEADDSQLKELAKISNAKVFDGRKDLVGAFRSVKGYN